MPPFGAADCIALGSFKGISASITLLSASLTPFDAADPTAFWGAASVFSDFVLGGGTGTS